MRPTGLAPGQPVKPARGMARHVKDMRHGMQAPGIIRAQCQPHAPRGFGAGIFAGFFQRKGVTAHQIATGRMVGLIGRQHPFQRTAHADTVALHEANCMADLHRQAVLRMAGHDPFHLGHRPAWAAPHPGIKRRNKSRLAQVQRVFPRDGLRRCQRLLRHRDQLAPAQHHVEQPLDRMGKGKARFQSQQFGQMHRRLGTMCQKGHYGAVPGSKSLGRGHPHILAQDITFVSHKTTIPVRSMSLVLVIPARKINRGLVRSLACYHSGYFRKPPCAGRRPAGQRSVVLTRNPANFGQCDAKYPALGGMSDPTQRGIREKCFSFRARAGAICPRRRRYPAQSAAADGGK